jgi:tellurite resistance protein
MATNYTTTLTDSEKKAMEYVALSVQDWADNALKNRARQAIDEIYNAEVARMTADPDITSIPADKDAVVLAADIKSAATRQAEADAAEAP